MSHDEDFAIKLAAAVDGLSSTLDADVILYHGPIERGCDLRLNRLIRQKRSRPNLALFITTGGGDPDAAYRIARCLQLSYKRFLLFVGSYCKSAGTLISVGADEIVLSDMAELGPLDIQIAKQDDLFGRDSGLTPVQALATLKAETFKAFENHFMDILTKSGGQITTLSAARFATRLTTECFSKIYQQIDPMKLGEYERATNITYQYGIRLDRGNLIEGDTLERLITDYPSHGFVIDREEAKSLFKEVREPTIGEQQLMDLLVQLGVAIMDKSEETAIEFLSRSPMIPTKGTLRGAKNVRNQKKRSNANLPHPTEASPGSDLEGALGPSRPKLPAERSKTIKSRKSRPNSPKTGDRNGKSN